MQARGDGVISGALVKILSLAAASLLPARIWLAVASSGPGAPADGTGASNPSANGGGSPQASAALARAVAQRDEWRRSREAALRDDFGETAHFRRANAELKPAVPGEKRVVFIGDSITAGWPLDQTFAGKGYINRGIGGQTTSQVLVRFRQDVIDLAPAVVVILLGTNDIAGNTGPISLADIQQNIASLAELAQAHHIAVALCAVLPVHGYTRQSEAFFPLRPPARIVELNRWLTAYAAERGHAFIDYFAAMVDGQGLLKKELADDGLHPNAAGYAIMAPLVTAALDKLLARRPVQGPPRGGLR